MKKLTVKLLGTALIAWAGLAGARTIVVNTVDNSDFSAGKTNLVYALQLLADGDTIHFAIPGPGVHYIDTPHDGYPLITKNNITIDGYSQQQPGSMASPNTASLHETNNAQLMICLSSTNGNALSMYTACSTYAGVAYPNFGFGDTEQALLGFFRASNAWVKGIAFIAAPQTATTQSPNPADNDCKTVCFATDAPDVSSQACQNFRVSGCWFGVDPSSRQVAYMPNGTTVATPAICIATYGTGTNGTPGFPDIENYSSGTIGVASNSANPRAEFNVFVTGYGFDSQGGPFRISGNFWGMLPDGTTLADISTLNGGAQQGDAFVEVGDCHDLLIGTDGDGVNDADEGNLFGSYANSGTVVNFYHPPQTNIVMAGNMFGVDIHTNSFGVGQNTLLVDSFNNVSQVRFGSDFAGVSDALEANTVADATLFKVDTSSSGTAHWISTRGNSFVHTATPSGTRPPIGDGSVSTAGLNVYSQFIDISGGTSVIIPVISPSTTTSSLSGTCGPRAARNMRVVLDLYEADTTVFAEPPQGKTWLGKFAENSAADSNPTEAAFTFNIASLGIAHGTPVTITATYIPENVTITSVQRSGSNMTMTMSGGIPPYDILGASTIDGTYTRVATSVGNTATFAAPAGMSFYQAVYHPQITSGSGMTSPFSDVFTMP